MNYWWVNQTDNWEDECEQGYLYAGKSANAYRKAILGLRVGDIVICTRKEAATRVIYALGFVEKNSTGKIVPRRITRKIGAKKQGAWPEGWEVSIEYIVLDTPVEWKPIWKEIKDHTEGSHFTKTNPGREGYIFPVPADTASEIFQYMNWEQPEGERFGLKEEDSQSQTITAVLSEVMQRRGHQKWARKVKQMWNDRCCVTGLDVKSLLTASHIVAWKLDEESRLDEYNGLCLSPAYNAAFDAYLISFLDDGTIQLSKNFSKNAAQLIGIDPKVRIIGLNPKHLDYLKRHRQVANGKKRA